MRPLVLHLTGVRSYREPITIDFEGRGLVAVVGDTGSGKSSLLEAMVYALYNRSTFEGRSRDLIAHGAEAMEVSLEFAAQARRYRVTRARSPGGYPPARHELVCLDDPTVPPVDGEAAVSAEVERLVGLGCSAFLKTVVLPQGRFADLLRATGTERARILRDIFRLEGLDLVRDEARAARDRAAGRLEPFLAERAGLPADPEAELAGRRAELAATEGAHESLSRAVGDHQAAGRIADEAANRAAGARSSMRALELAAAVDAAAALERAQQAGGELDAAEETAFAELAAADAEIERETDELERSSDGLGPEALAMALVRLQELGRRQERCRRRQAEVDRHAAALERASAEASVAEQAHDAARREAEGAEASLADAERSAMVAALLHNHAEHDQCPVCRQALPADVLADHADADASIRREHGERNGARRARTAAEDAQNAAQTARAAAGQAHRAARDELREERLATERARDELPESLRPRGGSDDDLEAALATVECAQRACEDRRRQIDGLRKQRQALAARRLAIETERRAVVAEPRAAALRTLDQLYDACCRACELCGEPVPPRVPEASLDEQLVASRSLVDAAGRLAERVDAIAVRADADGLAARNRAREVLAATGHDSGAALVAARDAAAGARAASATALALAEDQAPRAHELDRSTAPVRELVADLRALEGALAPSAFPRHAAATRQTALLRVATDVLGGMTGGRFAFADDFEVTDRSLGGQRGVRTLSGGETFLASLALSLALVEVTDRSGGRVEALFLDEGFGQLDADALDAALGELERRARAGRLVGLVSHVYSVAERVTDVLHVGLDASGSSEVRWLSPSERQGLLDRDAARLIAA